MKSLELDNYSDKEIVKALINMKAGKFFTVMNAIGAITQRLERRGKLIAKENSDEEVDNLIRRMFEDDNSQES